MTKLRVYIKIVIYIVNNYFFKSFPMEIITRWHCAVRISIIGREKKACGDFFSFFLHNFYMLICRDVRQPNLAFDAFGISLFSPKCPCGGCAYMFDWKRKGSNFQIKYKLSYFVQQSVMQSIKILRISRWNT